MSKKKSLKKNLASLWEGSLFLTVGSVVFAIGYIYGALVSLRDTVRETFKNGSDKAKGISPEERAKQDADNAAREATRAAYKKMIEADITGVTLKDMGIGKLDAVSASDVTTALIRLQAKNMQDDVRFSMTACIGFTMQVVSENNHGDFIRVLRKYYPSDVGHRLDVTLMIMRWNVEKQRIMAVADTGSFSYMLDSDMGRLWSVTNIINEYECLQGQAGNASEELKLLEYDTAVKKFQQSQPKKKYWAEVIDMGLPTTHPVIRNMMGLHFYMSDKHIDMTAPPTPCVTLAASYKRHTVKSIK